MNGVVQPLPVPIREKLTIRLPALRDRTNGLPPDPSRDNVNMLSEMNKATSHAPTKATDDHCDKLNETDETGDLLDAVDKAFDEEEEVDEEDGPDWMFEEQETRAKDPDYVFCPAPHHRQLLHLFMKHFCQHPLLPDREGELMAEEIRERAVRKMYVFCEQRGLREVWGYMWTPWYTPERWKLWVRSTTRFISRLRTTMNVENFWRQLKHDFLHHLLRPRLVQLIWILITKVTPEYLVRAEILEDHHRLGRSKPLTTYQRYFKSSWRSLAK